MLFVRDLPPVIDRRLHDRRAEHLLRRAVERLRDRPDTSTQEFHYPRGDDNVFTQLRRHGRRAARRRSGGSCCSRSASAPTRSCSATTSRPRAGSCSTATSASACAKIAPFLVFDRDPYLVLADGRLFWILRRLHDQSTAIRTRRRQRRGVNYIRNSVKVVDRRLPRHDDVLPRRRRRSDRRDATRGSFPACSSRSTRCRPTCAQHVRYPEGHLRDPGARCTRPTT